MKTWNLRYADIDPAFHNQNNSCAYVVAKSNCGEVGISWPIRDAAKAGFDLSTLDRD